MLVGFVGWQGGETGVWPQRNEYLINAATEQSRSLQVNLSLISIDYYRDKSMVMPSFGEAGPLGFARGPVWACFTSLYRISSQFAVLLTGFNGQDTATIVNK